VHRIQGVSMSGRFKSGSLSLLLMMGALSFSGSVAAQYAGPSVSSPLQGAIAPDTAMKVEYDEIKIMPGDIISIATPGIPELTTTASAAAGGITVGGAGSVAGLKVDTKGQIQLPYLGTVVVAGLTTSEAAASLSKALVERGILADPQVSVALIDSPSRLITVLGEVMKPMPLPAYGHLRLLDAISACGGLTPMASHAVTVRRLGVADPISIELGVDPKTATAGNIPLLPGDTIIVPRVGNIFVVGEVKTSEVFPLSGNAPVTVMRAITLAGGLKYSAALSKARIYRTTADNQHIAIMLDLKKLMNGKQQDVALLSEDVLYIPPSTIKAGLSGGAASVAAAFLNGTVYAAANLK
jgi:polysaccharide export outer membrane protein